MMDDTDEYQKLLSKYDELQKKYNQLEHDYSENTIIESMNDMKRKYEQLVANTVPSYKHNMLSEKFDRVSHTILSSEILIEHIVKGLKKIETISSMERINLLYKVQLELIILKEILQDSIAVARN